MLAIGMSLEEVVGMFYSQRKICRVKLEFKHANILQKTDAFSYWSLSRAGLL